MATMLSVLGLPAVQTALLAVGGLLFGWLKRREAVQRYRLDGAVEAMEAGVRETYEEYVRHCKSASVDGKLSDAEREEALARALEKASRYAARRGIDLLAVHAEEYLPVLIDRIVRERRGQ